jgi:two-component system sensor histidine kinase FlrB
MQSLPSERQKKHVALPGSARADRRALAAAFASFTQTAGVLETAYSKLQAEVVRLRQELEKKNRSLAQSLEENQRMRNYLARIVEGLPCGVLVFDNETKLRMINPAAKRMLGAGSKVPTEIPLPPPMGTALNAFPEDNFSREREWTVPGPLGERIIGVTRAQLQATEMGNDSIFILRDLTEAKQLERERDASSRTQALAEVATLLAHEIRNPLGSLELFAGLLADALVNQADLQPWINHIQAGLRLLAATVNNVLQFHSQPPPQLLSADLLRLVSETVEFLRPLARQKELYIEWRAGGDPVTILTDPSRLQQAFFNLALNAFRAMKPGGKLSIGVCRDEDASCPTVALTFSDQGEGIREENIGRIFEPGFTTRGGSPGLGLAVTRKVIEQHGGTIGVVSREGQGTTFTLTLPMQGELQGSGREERDVHGKQSRTSPRQLHSTSEFSTVSN